MNRHKNTYAAARSPAKSVPSPSHEPELVNMRYEEEVAEYAAKNFEEEGEESRPDNEDPYGDEQYVMQPAAPVPV